MCFDMRRSSVPKQGDRMCIKQQHKNDTNTCNTTANAMCALHELHIVVCVCVRARAGWWHKKNSIDRRGILYKRKLIRSSCFPYSILSTPSKLLFSFGGPFLPLPRFIVAFRNLPRYNRRAVCGVHTSICASNATFLPVSIFHYYLSAN